jgi:hypothetical protein
LQPRPLPGEARWRTLPGPSGLFAKLSRVGWTTGLAIYGAAVATGSTGWQFYSHRVTSRVQRRERASRVVGGVLAFLTSINPETGFVGGIPEARQEEAINHYMDDWEPLRRELEALRVADPSVDERARVTIEAVSDSFTYSVWAIRQRRVEPPSEQEWENLKTKYAAAKAAAEALKQAVQS